MTKCETPLDIAINSLGGTSAIARLVDPSGEKIKQQHVWYWLKVANRVPADRVSLLHEATDGVLSRHLLRPDLYPAEGEAA